MDLPTFKIKVLEMIQNNKLNLDLSGVATVMDRTRLYWSASYAVRGDGIIPPVSCANYETAQQQFQKHVPQEFVLSKLWKVDFIMSPDLSSCRWQVYYLFRE